ncbi:MAG TPA: hypothetical protein HPP76_09540 [Desulfuromonadales bacterium]|nr:hypothetical protein [Desulfuromonadales bacterium]
MITYEQLITTVANGEQLDVEFKSEYPVHGPYGLSDEEIAVVEEKS